MGKMWVIEDRSLLTLSADREKELQDLPLLAARTAPPPALKPLRLSWQAAERINLEP